MLSLLLDEHLSPEIVVQMGQKRPEIPIASVFSWQAGRFMAQPDDVLLTAASLEGRTLVTYDQKTILPIIVQWGHAGIDHAGVIFVDNYTMASNNFGALIRLLITVWDRERDAIWKNVVSYLQLSSSQ